MKVERVLKLPGGQAFETHHFAITLSEADLGLESPKSLEEARQTMDILARESELHCLKAAVRANLMSVEEFKERVAVLFGKENKSE
jgi:hypothetical protein